MTKQNEELLLLKHGIAELLYSFRKNGGDLDYCADQVMEDFEAHYEPLIEQARQESIDDFANELIRWAIDVKHDGLPEAFKKQIEKGG